MLSGLYWWGIRSKSPIPFSLANMIVYAYVDSFYYISKTFTSLYKTWKNSFRICQQYLLKNGLQEKQKKLQVFRTIQCMSLQKLKEGYFHATWEQLLCWSNNFHEKFFLKNNRRKILLLSIQSKLIKHILNLRELLGKTFRPLLKTRRVIHAPKLR